MPDTPLQRTSSTSSHSPITQDALDRLEANLQSAILSGIGSLKDLVFIRLAEHERRINELNNSHDKAVEQKRLTDDAATRIQERTVTTAALQVWKDEVNRALALQAGTANANAKTWSLVMGIVAILANIVIRVLLPPR